MTWTPLLLMHVGGGIIAFLFGSTALIAPKGGRLHRLSGIVFSVSMLAMAASGGFLALLRSQRVNVIAGVFTFYLISTAWLTVKRKANETGLAEIALLCVGFGVSPGIAVIVAVLAVLLNGLILLGHGSRNVDRTDGTKKDARTD